jgi:hypothetical protein
MHVQYMHMCSSSEGSLRPIPRTPSLAPTPSAPLVDARTRYFTRTAQSVCVGRA